MNKKIILLLAAVLLVAAGCNVSLKSDAFDNIKEDLSRMLSDKVSEGVQEGVSKAGEEAKEQVVAELTAQEINISTDNIDPKTVNVLENEEVKLKVISGDNKIHGFYLPGYDISETVEENDTEVITFKADKKGTFEYSCNLNCNDNVKGSLIVK